MTQLLRPLPPATLLLQNNMKLLKMTACRKSRQDTLVFHEAAARLASMAATRLGTVAGLCWARDRQESVAWQSRASCGSLSYHSWPSRCGTSENMCADKLDRDGAASMASVTGSQVHQGVVKGSCIVLN